MEAVIFIAIFVVVIGASLWSSHRQNATWQSVAQELGLRYVNGGLFDNPSLFGDYRGAKLSVLTEVSGSGKNKQVYTVVEVPLSALVPMDLEVYREGLFQKVGKALGGEDIQVGDEELDKTFIIKGIDRDKIRDLLTRPKVKARLLSAQNKYSTFRIDMGHVRIRESGRTASAEKLKGCIRAVVAAANAIHEVCMAKPNRTPQPQPHVGQNSAGEPAAGEHEAGRQTISGHPVGGQLAGEQSGTERPASEHPTKPPVGVSTVPFGRPAASGESNVDSSGAPDAESEPAASEEENWW